MPTPTPPIQRKKISEEVDHAKPQPTEQTRRKPEDNNRIFLRPKRSLRSPPGNLDGTHKWSNLWGIPGGKVKWGEPSVEALRRELLEETNLAVTDIEFVLVQDCIHSKEFYRDAHFVLLNYTCRCAGEPAVKLNDEARESRWVTMAQALELPLNQPTRKLLLAVAASKR